MIAFNWAYYDHWIRLLGTGYPELPIRILNACRAILWTVSFKQLPPEVNSSSFSIHLMEPDMMEAPVFDARTWRYGF
jgi:hypothetical protein